MKATIGKYAVWGNHDYGGGAARIYQQVMNAADFDVLKMPAKQFLWQMAKEYSSVD